MHTHTHTLYIYTHKNTQTWTCTSYMEPKEYSAAVYNSQVVQVLRLFNSLLKLFKNISYSACAFKMGYMTFHVTHLIPLELCCLNLGIFKIKIVTSLIFMQFNFHVIFYHDQHSYTTQHLCLGNPLLFRTRRCTKYRIPFQNNVLFTSLKHHHKLTISHVSG